jgi:hypothetical protein
MLENLFLLISNWIQMFPVTFTKCNKYRKNLTDFIDTTDKNYLSSLSENSEYKTRIDWSVILQEIFFLTKFEMDRRGLDLAVRL